jgi:hypothetical protein
MDEVTRNLVRQRAGNRCEYCGLPQAQSPLARLHVEHILPKKHGGTDAPDNLALAGYTSYDEGSLLWDLRNRQNLVFPRIHR